jgi:chaperonin GroES
MSFEILNDRVAVSLIEDTVAKTQSGLYIPTQASGNNRYGKVVAVGKGIYLMNGQLQPLDVKVGDTVLFNVGAGISVTVEGIGYLLIKEGDILLIKR